MFTKVSECDSQSISKSKINGLVLIYGSYTGYRELIESLVGGSGNTQIQ